MATDTKPKETDINTMMAEDYFTLGKFEKAVEIFKKIGKEVSKDKLERCATKSLEAGDIKNALSAFKIAGTDVETMRQVFIGRTMELLKDDRNIDIEKLKEILNAGKIDPSENEEIRNRLVELARKKMAQNGSAARVLEMYRMSGYDVPRKEVLEMAAYEIKYGTARKKDEGIAIMEEFGAIDELREAARYFLDSRKPNEKMARRLYELISKISKNK